MSLPAFCNQCGGRFLAEGRYTRFCCQACGLAFKIKADRLSKSASFAPTQTAILAALRAQPGEWIGRHAMIGAIYGANDRAARMAFTLALAIGRRSAFLTPEETARAAGMRLHTLYAWLDRGKVPGALKYRDRWRIPLTALSAIEPPPASRVPTVERVIGALNTSRPTPVRRLAVKIGINEACVRSAIQRARRYGYSIVGERGAGYRLAARARRDSGRMTS